MEGPDNQPRDRNPTPPEESPPPAGLPKVVSFRTLCRCGDEVWIENEGTLYRLRRTRQGKLILTK